jgi:superfamily I DNA/RNA helicase
MAIFVDSLVNISDKHRRKIKQVFEGLNDSYIIRTPVLAERTPAQVVIEGSNQSWLFLSCHDSKPDEKSLSQFIEISNRLQEKGFSEVKYLAIVPDYTPTTDFFYKPVKGVVILDRDEFIANGLSLIQKNMIACDNKKSDFIRSELISESVINTECTTRRPIQRHDNTAQLKAFFLNYDQEAATKLDMFDADRDADDGEELSVRLINGVAGSGKTLILINRAILYCKKYPDKTTLLLIHNKPITKDIEFKFDKYLGEKPKNLLIKTFHSFAFSQNLIANNLKFLAAIFDIQKSDFLLKNLTPENEEIFISLKLNEHQILSEFEYINDHLIADEKIYLEMERQGRGFSIQQSQRKLLWILYEKAMERVRSHKKGYLASLYIRELCFDPQLNDKLKKYDHILLDEAQFFFPSWLELVKKSLNRDGQLFMCADPNQGFLKSKLSWKSIGLNVRGRTKKLSYSYRTTIEILSAANALLELLKENSEDYLKPDFEKMEHGNKPKVIYSRTLQDEIQRFLNELKFCIQYGDIPLHQIMILCSDSYSPWGLKKMIEGHVGAGSVANYMDKADIENLTGDKMKLVTINSCTGMESGMTFVLGAGDLLNKHRNLDLLEDEKDIVRSESYRKLYVAMTRAGQRLVVFSTDRFPEQLTPYLDET